jgi:hypothetical protein
MSFWHRPLETAYRKTWLQMPSVRWAVSLCPSLFNLQDHFQEFFGSDFRDRSRADHEKNVVHQASVDPRPMTLRHRINKFLQPLSGDYLKTVSGGALTRRLHGFAVRRGISALRQQLAAFSPPLTGFRERYLGIDTQRQTLFLCLEPVFPPPPLATCRIDFKV